MKLIKSVLYLSIIFIFVQHTIFAHSIFQNEYKSKINTETANKVFKQLAQISDSELVEQAKRIIEDSIPGEIEYAEILLTEAIRKNPKNTNALIEFANLAEKEAIHPTQKIKKQFKFIYQAFLINSYDPKIRYKLANLFFELQQAELFQSLYENTLTQYPNHIETKIEKIKVLAQSNPQISVKLAKNVLEAGGDVFEFLPHLMFALKKIDEKNFSQNLHNFAKEYPDRWLWYQVGLAYMAERKFDDAEYALSQSIKLGNHIVGGLQIASIQYNHQNKTKEAISSIKTVLKEVQKNEYISSGVMYFAHAQLASALLQNKNMKPLKTELKFLAEHSYKNREYFIATMNEFIGKGKENLVIKYLKISIKQDPLFAYPYHALEKIYKKQKKYKLAKTMHKKIALLKSSSH